MYVQSTYICKLCLLQKIVIEITYQLKSNFSSLEVKSHSGNRVFYTFILHFYVMLLDEKRQKSLYIIF